MLTDIGGGVHMTYDYGPYGEGHYSSGSDPNHYLFTGKERDTETGNDYFGARYYESAMGRFLTPDWAATPVPVPYAKMSLPQTLNLYPYVENNPVTGVDPDGHQNEAEVRAELNRLADGYKVPRPVMQAVALTESHFNVNANNKSPNGTHDYGLMQINSSMIGKTINLGKKESLTITSDVKDPNQWKINAKAGAAMVTEQWRLAVKEQPNSGQQDRAQQTYSGYNAGTPGRDRYLGQTNGTFSDVRDCHFLQNYLSELGREKQNSHDPAPPPDASPNSNKATGDAPKGPPKSD